MDANLYKYSEYNLIPSGKKKLSFIIDPIQVIEGDNLKILEVGCGNGNIAIPLGYFGYDVLAIDMDQSSLEYAKKKNIFSNVHFEKIKFEDLQINQKFDIIIASEVLEHIVDPKQFIQSINKYI